ncbi:MAG: CvpA family protein [candidate division Zixibacteria bacterium]|nr:CvpA family protein [candidate division Zixibacteria bacterium]
MTSCDLSVILIVIIPGILGLKRGFFRELVETVGAILAAILSYRFYPTLSGFVGVQPESPAWIRLVTFVGMFIILMVAFSLAARLSRRFVRTISLGTYEHVAGFFLGALKGGILVAILCVAIIWSGPRGQEFISGSRLARADLLVFHSLAKMLPEDWYRKYQTVTREESWLGETNSVKVLPLALIPESTHMPYQNEMPGRLVTWDAKSGVGTIGYDWQGRVFSVRVNKNSSQEHGRLTDSLRPGEQVKFTLGFIPESGEVVGIITGPGE